MAESIITLTATRDGKPRHVWPKLSADDVNSLLAQADVLAKLPIGDGEHVYVNPAHVVLVEEPSDEGGVD